MDKHEILRHLDGFCSDIEIDDTRYVYTDGCYVCGMEVHDNAITVFYPQGNRERCERYEGISSYDDIVAIWQEYQHRLKRCQRQLLQG